MTVLSNHSEYLLGPCYAVFMEMPPCDFMTCPYKCDLWNNQVLEFCNNILAGVNKKSTIVYCHIVLVVFICPLIIYIPMKKTKETFIDVAFNSNRNVFFKPEKTTLFVPTSRMKFY